MLLLSYGYFSSYRVKQMLGFTLRTTQHTTPLTTLQSSLILVSSDFSHYHVGFSCVVPTSCTASQYIYFCNCTADHAYFMLYCSKMWYIFNKKKLYFSTKQFLLNLSIFCCQIWQKQTAKHHPTIPLVYNISFYHFLLLGFVSHQAIARTAGNVLIRLADSLLVPLNCSDYAETLEDYLNTAVTLYQHQLQERNISMGKHRIIQWWRGTLQYITHTNINITQVNEFHISGCTKEQNKQQKLHQQSQRIREGEIFAGRLHSWSVSRFRTTKTCSGQLPQCSYSFGPGDTQFRPGKWNVRAQTYRHIISLAIHIKMNAS